MIKNQEYRTWRIIILGINILIHVTIFLSLSNFKFNTLFKRKPSYYEYFVYSDGKGYNPGQSSKPSTGEDKTSSDEELNKEKVIASPDNILRVSDGVKVFSDSSLMVNRSDSLIISDNVSMEGVVQDSSENSSMYNSGDAGFTVDGAIKRPFEGLPLFMGGDANNFSDWLRSRYVLFSEKVSGTVIVNFTISRHGGIKEIEIENCDNKRVKNELIKLVQSSAMLWTPYKKGGRPQDFGFTQLINFN